MAPSPEERPRKKTRASASKVRTGCVTCKIRHVKCDEGKPFCNRCTSTGRRCDGYAPPKPTRACMRNTVTIYVPPLQAQRQLLPLPGWREVDEFHRFIAPRLSGFFQSDFWNTFILQMSQSEPAIRHAIAAITAINSDIERLPVPNHPARPIAVNRRALKESSDAMRSLTKRIQEDPRSSLVPLVACLLFTCLECMRGCVDAALIHITNGFAILNNVMSAARPTNGQPARRLHEFDLIDRHVAPVFVRLNVVCMLFGRLTACCGPDPEIGDSFDSLEDARLQFYKLAYKCARFAREANIRLDAGQSGISDVMEKARLQRQSSRWSELMEDYVERKAQTMGPSERTACDLLRLHARTIKVRLVSSLEPEHALDRCARDFREIIRLASAVIAQQTAGNASHGSSGGIVSRTSSPGPGASSSSFDQARRPSYSHHYEPPKFVFEMGVIPSLYFTATRCRLPHVRRQALALLREAPRREGLWNAHVAAKVAEEVMRIEEGGTVPSSLVLPTPGPEGSSTRNTSDKAGNVVPPTYVAPLTVLNRAPRRRGPQPKLSDDEEAEQAAKIRVRNAGPASGQIPDDPDAIRDAPQAAWVSGLLSVMDNDDDDDDDDDAEGEEDYPTTPEVEVGSSEGTSRRSSSSFAAAAAAAAAAASDEEERLKSNAGGQLLVTMRIQPLGPGGEWHTWRHPVAL